MIILELISPHFFEQKSLLGKKITIIEEDRLSPAARPLAFNLQQPQQQKAFLVTDKTEKKKIDPTTFIE